MSKLTDIIKSNKNDIIKPVAVLLSICIVIPLALALTNKITVNRIKELEEKTEKSAMAGLIEAESFEAETFGEGEKAFEYYLAEKDGETVGYIFITSAKGYGGEVSVMTAINTDSTIKAVNILDVSGETPGLGQNAAKEDFYTKYAGKSSGVKLLKNGAKSENNEINAVTGATITSTAVTNAVNEALDNYSLIFSDTEVPTYE